MNDKWFVFTVLTIFFLASVTTALLFSETEKAEEEVLSDRSERLICSREKSYVLLEGGSWKVIEAVKGGIKRRFVLAESGEAFLASKCFRVSSQTEDASVRDHQRAQF